MGFGFFRTIWISLRAVNYTTQAFQDTVHGLTKLQQAQLRLKMDAARNMMAVGAMYVAMGGMAIMIINRIMQQSELGQKVLGEFGDNVSKSMSKLGDSFARVMGPLLNIVAKILELATANPIISDLLAGLIMMGAVILIVAGAVKLFSGAVAILNLQLMVKKLMVQSNQQTLLPYIGTTHAATGATMGLATAVAAVTGGFAIAYTVLSTINSPIASAIAVIAGLTIALWALFIAESAASVGIALVAGGIAAAGAVTLASQYGAFGKPEYQMGTRMLTKTGPIIGHRGEVVYNPENQLPTQINRDANRQARATTEMNVDINIQELHTKSDFDDTEKKLRRALYGTMREQS